MFNEMLITIHSTKFYENLPVVLLLLHAGRQTGRQAGSRGEANSRIFATYFRMRLQIS